MFACVLACTTAAARVLMRMAHSALLPAVFGRANRRHGTPGPAIALSAGLMFATTAALALRGVEYRPVGAAALLRRNLLIYGLGGLVAPFIGIKLIDLVVQALRLA